MARYLEDRLTARGRKPSCDETINALAHDNPIEEVFEDQIACADLVVLNKRDLLDGAGADRAIAAIAGVLPRAVKVITTS